MPPTGRSTSASRASSSSSTGAPKRARGHITKSCSSCRRRKVRCSGDQPSCAACLLYHEDCNYDEKHDGRKPASKAYVASLEERVRHLEAILDSHGLSQTAAANGTIPAPAPAARAVAEDEELHHVAIESLRIDELGEFTSFGHSSVFMHLPGPHGRSSAQNVGPQALPAGSASPTARPATSFLCPGPEPHPSAITPSPASAGGDDSAMSNAEDFQWARNLPEVKGMDEQLHAVLLDLFFAYYNSWTSSVDEQLFRRDMAICLADSPSAPSRTNHYSPLLHNTIIAIARSYSPIPYGAEAYAERAKTLIEAESDAGLLSSMHGLFLLADHYAGSGRHKVGFLYYGIGHFSASNLGLCISLDPLEKEGLVHRAVKGERERTFASWTRQDKLWATYLGRQPMVMQDTSQIPLPAIDEATDALPWRADLSDPSTPAVPGYTSTTLHHSTKLISILERVLKVLYGFNTRLYAPAVMSQVSAFHVELERWQAELPTPISISPYGHKTPPTHILTMHMALWFTSILLHRPYYTRANGKELLPINHVAVKHCERAASKIVNLVEMYRSSPGLRYCTTTLTQIVFLAGTVHLLSAINSTNSPKRHSNAVAAAEACQSALNEMGQSWKCATQSAEILRRLTVEWCGEGGGQGDQEHRGGLKRGRSIEDEASASMDLHRNLWDPSWGSIADPLPPLPHLPSQSTSAEPYVINLYDRMPSTSAPPLPTYHPPASFGRYQPPIPAPALTTTSTPSFTRYQPPQSSLPPSVDPAFAPMSSFSDYCSTNPFPFSGGGAETPSNDTMRIDPFASGDIFALLQGQDGFGALEMMPMGGWAGHGLGEGEGGEGMDERAEELPQWLKDLGMVGR